MFHRRTPSKLYSQAKFATLQNVWLRRLFQIVFLLCAATILYLALGKTSLDTPIEISDKLQHFAAFWGLALLADLSFNRFHRVRNLMLLSVGLLAFGGAIELIQSTLTYRSAEWTDLFADACGIGANGIWSLYVSPFYRRFYA